nr:replication initiation protein RepC [Ruegeria sp. EL01]
MQNHARCAESASFKTYPVLRPGLYRSHVEGLLTDVSRYIGMSDALLRATLTMIRYTRPDDWTNPDVEPICSKMQADLAIALGKTDRAVRNDEHALERIFGFIKKEVSANGSRRSDGNGYRQGLSFSPLIEMIEDLQALRDQARYEEQHRKTLRIKCSALRRLVKNGLMELHPNNPDHEGLCRVRDMFLSWAPRYSAYRTIEALEEHYEEASQASIDVDDIRQLCIDSSGRAEPNFRRYIHDTTENTSVTCNASVDKRPGDKSPDSVQIGSPPDGGEHCLENKHGEADGSRNLKIMENMTLERLFDLASFDLQAHVAFCRGDRGHLREIDFIHGAHGVLHPLGINESAYHTAISEMGQYLTTLCLLVIDANRDHPVTPVRNPGGLLRAMTRKHASGQLNIAGSLIGLSERRKQEEGLEREVGANIEKVMQ